MPSPKNRRQCTANTGSSATTSPKGRARLLKRPETTVGSRCASASRQMVPRASPGWTCWTRRPKDDARSTESQTGASRRRPSYRRHFPFAPDKTGDIETPRSGGPFADAAGMRRGDLTDAGMVKLVDTPDLGSGAARRGSSSLSTRTRTTAAAGWGSMFPTVGAVIPDAVPRQAERQRVSRRGHAGAHTRRRAPEQPVGSSTAATT